MKTERKNQPLISQIGGIVAMACFFLPWASCQGEDMTSGAEMGGITWLVFIAAGAIAGSAHYFNSNGSPAKAKPIVIASGIAAIAVMVLRYFAAREEIGQLLKIEYGGVCTLGGLLLALYGSLFLENPSESPSFPITEASPPHSGISGDRDPQS